jgi:ASC-1-like (ASCH) protein
MVYEKNLSEPWFSLIKLGLKKCEGRLNKGDFTKMKKGDIIEFYNEDFGKRKFKCKITSIHNYKNFEEYLTHESLEKCLPGIDTIDEGVSVYRKYFNEENENKYGIVAIRIIVLKNVKR